MAERLKKVYTDSKEKNICRVFPPDREETEDPMASEKELFVTKQYIPIGQPISQNDHTIIYKVKCVAEKGAPEGILKMYRRKNIKNLYTRLWQLDYSEWPHIYSVKYFDENTLVVEEYLQGATLAELMEQNRIKGIGMSEEQAYGIMDKLSECIAELLKLQPPIIHHDLRPSNIFVTKSGAVKLLDFVPEYASKKKFTFHNILDTLGAIFHEMLTGKAPKHGKCTYQGRFAPVIRKCMEKNPEKQYANMEEMKDGLKYARTHDVKGGSDDAASIPFWLTIPFQGTILAFEWALFTFFLTREAYSTMSLFIITFCLHSLLFAFRRFVFMRENNVHIGPLRTFGPIAALLAVLAVIFFAISALL